ncbi:MAG: MlaD family protein [Rikenellaceae bacterium]|jgi:phospholipid/cholesterol/gamma-HCH transport system substrate-binding protein|nr:MlaD family protein [Rikenellaceae bacterium]
MAKIKVKREVRIGLFAVAMILVLYWGVNFIKGTDLIRGTKTYFAVYDRVNGLQPSSPVVINGYKVGVVQKMHFQPDQSRRIVLELRIKSRFHIPDNSRARMYSDGLMGGKAIAIEMGDSPRYMERGDTLNSRVDKDLFDISSSDVEYVKQKASDLVNSVTGTFSSVDTLITQNEQNIAIAIANLAQITGQLADVLSSGSGDLKGTITDLRTLSRALASTGPRIENTMKNMEHFSATLASPKVEGSIDKLSESMTGLSALLDKVNSGQGTAGKLMTDETLYDSLTIASSNLALLLEDLKANPKRYVHFSLFGGGGKKDK